VAPDGPNITVYSEVFLIDGLPEFLPHIGTVERWRSRIGEQLAMEIVPLFGSRRGDVGFHNER